MDKIFRQRQQKLPGGVVQVDAPRGGGLLFAPLALFAAVADTDGAPRVMLGRMFTTWSGDGYEGGEKSCTPVVIKKAFGNANAVRCALVNEAGLHAVHALLHSRLLASARCSDALLQPLRDLAAHFTWPALPPLPPDDEDEDEEELDEEEDEEPEEAETDAEEEEGGEANAKKRRRRCGPGAYDDRRLLPACNQGNLTLLEKVAQLERRFGHAVRGALSQEPYTSRSPLLRGFLPDEEWWALQARISPPVSGLTVRGRAGAVPVPAEGSFLFQFFRIRHHLLRPSDLASARSQFRFAMEQMLHNMSQKSMGLSLDLMRGASPQPRPVEAGRQCAQPWCRRGRLQLHAHQRAGRARALP